MESQIKHHMDFWKQYGTKYGLKKYNIMLRLTQCSVDIAISLNILRHSDIYLHK